MKKDMQQRAAQEAIKYINGYKVLGIGTGSTSNCFIEYLAEFSDQLDAVIPSSDATKKLLQQYDLPIAELNAVTSIPLYIDGADAYNKLKQLVKGGGGALTREKILAAASDKFICIVDANKQPSILGSKFPIAVEVIPMARSYVARQIVKLGGSPVYRNNFTTDNGNIILDVHNWQIEQPIKLESEINQIAGVVAHGLFARRGADKIIVGSTNSVHVID